MFIPISDLQERYGIARTASYERVRSLGIIPIKEGTKSFITESQLQALDELHEHLANGGTLPTPVIKDEPLVEDSAIVSSSPQTLMVAAIAEAITQSIERVSPRPDPLSAWRSLEEISLNHWEVPSSVLSPLVGLKSLPSKDFERYGFRFEAAGKVGSQKSWRVYCKRFQ